MNELDETLTVTKHDCSEVEEQLKRRCQVLEDRVQQSTRENDLMHEESGKVSSC